MPSTVIWDNTDQTVVRITLTPPWGWDDYDSAITEVFRLINSVDYTVNVISNIPQGTSFPAGNVLSHFRHTTDGLPKNTGQIVVVGGNLAANIVIAVFGRAYHTIGSRLAFVNGLDEARAIFEHPPTLGNDQGE